MVQGQTYYLRVFGVTPDVVNGYNMTIVNTAPPLPTSLELSRSVPNGEQDAPLGTQGTPGTGDLPPNAPPKTDILLGGDYAMKLEFGKRKGDVLPGKIYLCFPDKEQSYVAGEFEAKISDAFGAVLKKRRK